MSLTDRDKAIATHTMKQAAEGFAALLEGLANDPMMAAVDGQTALRMAAKAARNTSNAVWPERLQ